MSPEIHLVRTTKWILQAENDSSDIQHFQPFLKPTLNFFPEKLQSADSTKDSIMDDTGASEEIEKLKLQLPNNAPVSEFNFT